jgi:hypothetical protein
MYKRERNDEYLEEIDKLIPDYQEYYAIFKALLELKSPNRLLFSEWVKFSL